MATCITDPAMTTQPPSSNPDAVDARRKRARRTAWIFAGIALAVYAGFILSSALGH